MNKRLQSIVELFESSYNICVIFEFEFRNKANCYKKFLNNFKDLQWIRCYKNFHLKISTNVVTVFNRLKNEFKLMIIVPYALNKTFVYFPWIVRTYLVINVTLVVGIFGAQSH